MEYIRQVADGVSSWFYARGNGAAAAQPGDAARDEAGRDTESLFASLASQEALQRPLAGNYDIALSARNLRNDKVRVRSNLAAAADKVGVDAVRQAIVARLGKTGPHQAIAHQQLNRVVRCVPSIVIVG
ncbi:hypothetical protein ACUSIJ_09605 [Pseudochelatococcus sp. B33]